MKNKSLILLLTFLAFQGLANTDNQGVVFTFINGEFTFNKECVNHVSQYHDGQRDKLHFEVVKSANCSGKLKQLSEANITTPVEATFDGQNIGEDLRVASSISTRFSFPVRKGVDINKIIGFYN